MTKYFYDTEFLEDGSTIELISIGIVCEDGREYYAVNSDMHTGRVFEDRWLRENVWIHLPIAWKDGKPTSFIDLRSPVVKPKWVIANEVRAFMLDRVDLTIGPTMYLPELWAYYGAYDHVALAQLWGKMIDLPEGIPMWTHELMQLFEESWITEKPPQANEHNALADARWNKELYDMITKAGH